MLGIVVIALLLYGQSEKKYADTAALERLMEQKRLVGVQTVDPTIKVNLKYASVDNFLQRDLYGGLCHCYLTKEAAIKLANAQRLLRKKKPQFSLLVLDCARPGSVQRMMWERLKGTPEQKYVADPSIGSMHNYGCAVDLTIVDSLGAELDMGTPFDFLGEQAQPRLEKKFAQQGKLSRSQIENRKLLREIMIEAGFRSIGTEWWHFDAFSRKEVKQRFSIIDPP
jgi:zinc D-Ala-D-Ala dipeptidase